MALSRLRPACACHVSQTFFAVEPPEPLLVHVQSFLAEQKMQPPIAEPATDSGQLADALTEAGIRRRIPGAGEGPSHRSTDRSSRFWGDDR